MHDSAAVSMRRIVACAAVLMCAAAAASTQHRAAAAGQQTVQADVVWCPMHPDVRAPAPGKCPICFMDLVPIPPPRIGEYRLDVAQTSKGRRRGLALRVVDPKSGEPVEAFTEVHERLFHLFVIGRDLRSFAHEHPQRTAKGFEIDLDLRPGAYMLIADFMPANGTPQLVHTALLTPGYRGSPFGPATDLRADVSPKRLDGIRVEAAIGSPAAGREMVARFTVHDARSGGPITDLEPFLGAAGHLLVVNADLTQAVHAHPEGALTGGPEIAFPVLFPAPGMYKMWLQIQRRGKVSTAPFVVRVES